MKKTRHFHGIPLDRGVLKMMLLMKLGLILILASLQVSAKTFSQELITVDFRNVKLEKALKEVEHKSDYRFVYSSLKIPQDIRITFQGFEVPVKEVVEALLNNTGLHYQLIGDKLMVITKVKEVPPRKIIGKVTNKNGEPLANVTVQVKGTETYTVTDANGAFQINVDDNATSLVFSYVDMETREISIAGKTAVEVKMSAANADLGEVVVVGYGSQRKKDLTGSVVTVGDEAVKNRPVSNLNEALVGQLAGVNIALNDGSPGGETSIRIRGVGSISAGNEPLYVVDGFPTTQTFANSVLPSNIESVNVLKDASATAIYGSRGSNGVVLITTKSGKGGEPMVNLNISSGVAHVAKRDYYHMLNTKQYMEFTKEARNNQWVSSGPGRNANDPNSVRPAQYQIPDFLTTDNGVNTDWQSEIFQNAPIQNYDVNIRGGNQKLRYFFSGGYYDNKGVVLGSGYTKYTAQMKVDASLINNVLEAGMNLMPSFADQQVAQYAGTSVFNSVIASALAMPPFVPVRNDDGTYADLMHPPAGFYPIQNPVQLAKEVSNRNKSISNLLNAYLKLNITKDIELRTNFGATLFYTRNDFYHPSTVPNAFEPAPVNPNASSSTGDVYNWISETTLSYQKVFANKHRLNVLGGFSSQKEFGHGNSINANSFPNDFVHTLNAGVVTGGNSSESEWSILSGYGRANYSYMDKYLLTATFRGDGSSRFGRNTKWGYFPSAAVGWVVSKEDFLVASKAVSYLKLRASMGVSGNNSIPNYAHIALLSNTNQTFGSGSGTNYTGIFPSSLSNESLTWEKSQEVDFGIDAGFIDDRITISLDYYNRRSSDLLLNVNLPTTTGFNSLLTNIGEVENKGVEVLVTSKNTRKGAFQWYTTFNFSYNKNKVLRLGPTGDPIYNFAGTRITAVGGSIGATRGLKQIGVLTQKDIDAGVAIFPGEKAGDAKYFDADGDGVISNFNGNDGVFLGDANPSYLFGLSNRFEYRNFDFSILINGQTGGYILDLTSQGLWDPGGTNAMFKQYNGRYISDDQPGNGTTIRAGNTNGGTPDTRLTQSTDYLRIRNIALGYNFVPGRLKFAKGIRAYVSVENAITWKKAEGYNPQQTSFNSGNDATLNGITGGGSYPLPFTLSAGINLTLQ